MEELRLSIKLIADRVSAQEVWGADKVVFELYGCQYCWPKWWDVTFGPLCPGGCFIRAKGYGSGLFLFTGEPFFPLEASWIEGLGLNRWDVLALTSLTDHSARSVLTKLRHPRNVSQGFSRHLAGQAAILPRTPRYPLNINGWKMKFSNWSLFLGNMSIFRGLHLHRPAASNLALRNCGKTWQDFWPRTL